MLSRRIALIACSLLVAVACAYAAVAPNVVHVIANGNCYFGSTENLSDAQKGNIGTVYIEKGHSIDVKVSHNNAILYYGMISTPNQGMPMPHMTMRGHTNGGATIYAQ